MIPVTLRLQNFLSYGSPIQTISFENYKLICLSGKNGHGKSALLDAITWALWGQARKTINTSKADLGIVKLGQTDVMVIFDFIFNNQMYRVKRVFSTKYGKPKAHVDFGTYQRETDYFTPLTEKTIKKTQECINTTLGLDFEGFINSSFLRQGQANEFSKKSPKERKDVLASILGLDQYEQAKKRALEEMRTAQQERDSLDKLAHILAQECVQKEQIQKESELLLQKLNVTTEEEKNLHKQQTLLEQEEKNLHTKEQEYGLLLFEQKQHTQAHTALLQEGQAIAQTWHRLHAHLLTLPDKTDLEKEQQTTMQHLITCQQTLQKSFTLKEELLACKTDLQAFITTTQQQQHATMQTLVQEEEKNRFMQEHTKEILTKLTTEKVALNITYQETENAIKKLTTTDNPHLLIGDTQELQSTFDRYKLFYHRWVEQGNWTNKELQNIIEKQSMAQDNENPSCPLCEQNLSQGRKRFLHKKFNDQKLFLIHRFNRLKQLIEKTKQTLHTMHTALEISKQVDSIFKEQETAHKALTTNMHAHDTATKELIQLHEKATVIAQQKKVLLEKQEQELIQTTTYQMLFQKQKNLEKTMLTLQPYEKELPVLQKKQEHLHKQLQEWHTIAQEKPLQHERKKQLYTLAQHAKEKKQKLAHITEKLCAYADHQKAHEKIIHEKKILHEQLTLKLQEKEQLIQKKGSFETQLKKLQEQEILYKKTLQERENAHKIAQDLQAIAQALGKDGIQALLIEEALPEIEQEANELLSRLTDNQTHIFIESLRDLKKGGTRETLDINISDSNGIRPYELFSGGEAFRLDFALRIAISKLLARRAGTSLQTLIIDEGFGSQDEEGLSKIMDVLYTIQDDFEKIIIVSHLSSMKDQFPVHFTITKGPQGSKVTVKEQG